MTNRQFLLFLRVKKTEKHSTEEVFVEAVWTDLTYDLELFVMVGSKEEAKDLVLVCMCLKVPKI